MSWTEIVTPIEKEKGGGVLVYTLLCFFIEIKKIIRFAIFRRHLINV